MFGIQVGVSINILVKSSRHSPCAVTAKGASRMLYNDETAELNKARTFAFLEEKQHVGNVTWQALTPDKRHTWLTADLHNDFDTFVPMGSKTAKASKGNTEGTLFKTYSLGVVTNRDAWAYNFNADALTSNLTRMMKYYNGQVFQWEQRDNREITVNDFIDTDDTKIKWTRSLKSNVKTGKLAEFSAANVRTSLYRPFTKSHLYFDRMMNECVYVFPSIFPTPETEEENQVICIAGIGNRKGFGCLATDKISTLDMGAFENSQCFPFYTYDEDGTSRRENITDWALTQFQKHYADDTITKWNIFHYTYGLLHQPEYREMYQENLKRDLPHIPFAEDFLVFAKAGARLAELHINYESQLQYAKLEPIETPGMQVNLQVERMKFSKDKTQLKYNDFLTLDGIPPEVFEYRLGNRSALEWVVDQYRVKTDKRSGLVNNPNREEDAEYIVRLIGQVITVSLETVAIVKGLPALKV